MMRYIYFIIINDLLCRDSCCLLCKINFLCIILFLFLTRWFKKKKRSQIKKIHGKSWFKKLTRNLMEIDFWKSKKRWRDRIMNLGTKSWQLLISHVVVLSDESVEMKCLWQIAVWCPIMPNHEMLVDEVIELCKAGISYWGRCTNSWLPLYTERVTQHHAYIYQNVNSATYTRYINK